MITHLAFLRADTNVIDCQNVHLSDHVTKRWSCLLEHWTQDEAVWGSNSYWEYCVVHM